MSTDWHPPGDLFRRNPCVVTHESVEGPPLSAPMIAAAERLLGVRLPASYLALVHGCNGGYFRYELGCPTTVPTSWAPDHVGVADIFGIPPVDDGDPSDPRWCGAGILCSSYMIREWGLPPEVVLLTGDGHSWIALDYREGPDEPAVVWLDVELGQDVRLADDFASFIDSLRPFEVAD